MRPGVIPSVMHAQGARPVILIIEASGARRRIVLDRDLFTIGRTGCDVELSDSKVSTRHAELSLKPDGIWIADLDSLNGTFVNGTRVTRKLLHPLDVIRVGFTELHVTVDADHTKTELKRPEPSIAVLCAPPPTGQPSRTTSFSRIFTIGHERCTLNLPEPRLSSPHVALHWLGEELVILSFLGTEFPPVYNGKSVASERLKSGDTFEIAEWSLRFEFSRGDTGP